MKEKCKCYELNVFVWFDGDGLIKVYGNKKE